MKKHKGVVISGFDRTGNMVRPWAEAGYLCYCIDLQHTRGERRKGNIVYVGADMCEWLPPYGKNIVFQAFFPPCTHLATSGARWFKDKGLGRLSDAISLFAVAVRLAEWIPAPYLIENPVSTISSYWRRPDFTFDPCDYAGYEGGEDDTYTKRTCLWTGKGFRMPQRLRLPPTKGSLMNLIPSTPEQANLRSATPRGFARAIFESNAPCLRNFPGGKP